MPELVYAYQEDKIFELSPGPSSDEFTPILRLATNIAAEADIPLRVLRMPVTRMFRHLENGTSNYGVMVKTPRVEGCCIVSERPVYYLQLGVYRLAGTSALSNVEALQNKKLIMFHGYSYGTLEPFLKDKKNNIEKVMASSQRSALALLAAKRADYILGYDQPAVHREGERLNVDSEFDALIELDLHLVLNKSYPNAKAVMQKLEAIALDLQGRGKIEGAKVEGSNSEGSTINRSSVESAHTNIPPVNATTLGTLGGKEGDAVANRKKGSSRSE